VHSPHLILRLGHNCTRVSTSPKTATQTPISVNKASVDRPCDWTALPVIGFRRATRGIAAAWIEEIKNMLSSIRLEEKTIFVVGAKINSAMYGLRKT
jgi:hypothetical protein